MALRGRFAALFLGVLSCSVIAAAQAKIQSTNQVQALRKPGAGVTNKTSKTRATVPVAPQQVQPQPQSVVYTPPPLRPSQMAAIAPRISYQNGQLTVLAENSNLTDILNGIRSATGMRIDSTGSSGGERVAAKIGPASVRDVLLSLLEGSRYDFIMMGSSNDPDRIEAIVLTPKSGTAGAVAASGAPRPAVNAMAPPDANAPDDSESSDDNEGFAQPTNPEPPQPGNQPGIQPGQPGAETSAPGAAVSPEAQQGVKTPEQLLQDLRNMEQQRQQQQQQQQQTPNNLDPTQRPPRTTRPQ